MFQSVCLRAIPLVRVLFFRLLSSQFHGACNGLGWKCSQGVYASGMAFVSLLVQLCCRVLFAQTGKFIQFIVQPFDACWNSRTRCARLRRVGQREYVRVFNRERSSSRSSDQGRRVDLCKGMNAGTTLPEKSIFVVGQEIAAISKAGAASRECGSAVGFYEATLM